MTNPELEKLIAAWIDGRISESESALLQSKLIESSEARTAFRQYTNLDAALSTLARGASPESAPAVLTGVQPPPPTATPKSRFGFWLQFAAALSVLFLVGSFAYQLGKTERPLVRSAPIRDAEPEKSEQTISGHATLRRVAGIKWSKNKRPYKTGDVLPAGTMEFDKGVAEIDFFCGATVVIEGPAKIELESDWSVRLLAGRLRANVPPAARGFVVKAEDSDIIDLGTEFALEVADENVRVQVVDGEIKFRGGPHDGEHLITNQRPRHRRFLSTFFPVR